MVAVIIRKEVETKMIKTEYISVTEFAKLAGISRQQVYNKMRAELSSFVEEVDNKKMLKTEVLQTLGVKKVSNKFDLSNELDTFDRLVKHLENEIVQLRNENEALKQELSNEREQNRTQGAELLRLSSQVGESLKQLTTERAVTQTKLLADTLIDGQRSSEPPKKTHWWQKGK